MSALPQTWTFGDIRFHLVHDDIFEVPARAIVSSDQTDFYSHCNPSTVRGQIYLRYGNAVQDQLNAKTQGRALPRGTVLKTTAPDTYESIYHIGFHHSHEWLDPEASGEDEESEFVRIITSGIREVLERFAASETPSIAFPMIGCGLFRLDPALLAYEFMNTLMRFARSASFSNVRDIWLVVYDAPLVAPVLNSVVQSVIDQQTEGFQWEPLRLGIPHLDRFEEEAVQTSSPKWGAWTMVRYVELLIHYMFSHLASRHAVPLRPEDVIASGTMTSFGYLRRKACERSEGVVKAAADEWTQFLAHRMLHDCETRERLLRINQDRNAIAHGRSFRPADAIREDVEAFVDVSTWKSLRGERGSPDLSLLAPWLGRSGDRTGILERWSPEHWRYVIPHSGEVFRLPRENGA